MQFTSIVILEAVILALSCSADAFLASFSYGSKKIRIPMLSVQIINIVSSLILGISLIIGTAVKDYFPNWLTTFLCFIILFSIGINKILDSITKSIIRKYNKFNTKLKFSILNFRLILYLYANPEEADFDSSRTISATEATSLAVALSLDGMAIGLGAGFGNINPLILVLSSLIIETIAILSGCYIGNRLAQKIPFNISWLSGAILIILAISKLF